MIRFLLIFSILIPADILHAAPDTMPIQSARTWMYQLQNLENPGAIETLAKSNYDLLVVEPTATVKDQKNFDMKSMVARLHAGKPGRIVLAYLDACQAESFRTYWTPDWRKPTRSVRGSPDFILIPDPDGWSDDYNVAFWDPRWQQLFATAKDSQVRTVMNAGFDGVYLDWIDAYDDNSVAPVAKAQHINPAHAMVDYLLLIRKTAREINPHALIVQQNAVGLLDADPRLPDAIDALGVEDTWFSGKSNAHWGAKGAGNVPNRDHGDDSTANRLKRYAQYIAAGKPVFTIDYCRKPENVARVYQESAAHGCVPLVTQVSLERITETPPPVLAP